MPRCGPDTLWSKTKVLAVVSTLRTCVATHPSLYSILSPNFVAGQTGHHPSNLDRIGYAKVLTICARRGAEDSLLSLAKKVQHEILQGK